MAVCASPQTEAARPPFGPQRLSAGGDGAPLLRWLSHLHLSAKSRGGLQLRATAGGDFCCVLPV